MLRFLLLLVVACGLRAQMLQAIVNDKPPASGLGNITFVGAADLGNNGAIGSSYTVAYTVGSGSNRLLIVSIAGDTIADNISAVTYAGASMTLGAKITSGPGWRWTYLWYLFAPASGTNNLIVTTNAATYALVTGADYAGADSAVSPASNTCSQAAPTGTLTCAVTTTINKSWIMLAAAGYDASMQPLAGTGSTLRAADATFGIVSIYDSGAISPAGSASMEWHYPSNTSTLGMNSVVVAFAPK